MRGREFLGVAQRVVTGGNEPGWRAAVIHAYYALFLECRDTLTTWGRPVPGRSNPHQWVRLTLIFAGDSDLKTLSNYLDRLLRLRNQASYDLGSLPAFATVAGANQTTREAGSALVLLDAIEADPARRAAAIASLPP